MTDNVTPFRRRATTPAASEDPVKTRSPEPERTGMIGRVVVERAIRRINICTDDALALSEIDNEDDQNAIVAEAMFLWLERRVGSTAIACSMLSSIASRRHFHRDPEPPGVA